MTRLEKYGVSVDIDFILVDVASSDFITGMTHASGDTKISKDGGTLANTTNGFTEVGGGYYKLTLTATEMQAARVVLVIKDQGTKAYSDNGEIIQTYGHASASMAFDLDTASVAQTGDTYALANGASGFVAIKGDAVDIEGKVDGLIADIGTNGAGLTAIPWNSAWDGEVQSKCTDAIEAYDPPTNAEMVARTLAAADYSTSTAVAALQEVADAILLDTGTTIPGTLSAIAGYIDTEIGTIITALSTIDAKADSILGDTSELQADWANGGRLDLILDARASQTSVDDLPTNAELATALAGSDDAVLAQVALVKGKTDNLPSDPADQSIIISATDAILSAVAVVDGVADAIKLKTDNLPANPAAVDDIPTVEEFLTTQMTESYAADGAAPTLAQALFLIMQSFTEFSISGTTITVKKLDGSTAAASFTLDSATTPTSRTRAS